MTNHNNHDSGATSAGHAEREHQHQTAAQDMARTEVPVAQHPLAAVVGRMVHYWCDIADPRHVRHDLQPFTAKVIFVHSDGDVSVHGHSHYGEAFVDHHVKLREAIGGERHGHGGTVRVDSFCTWPVRGK